MKGLFDNHNHSQFSFDGKRTSVEASARAAADAGLGGLCFSDHCDHYVPPMKASFEDLKPEHFDVGEQQEEISRVQQMLGADIAVIALGRFVCRDLDYFFDARSHI